MSRTHISYDETDLKVLMQALAEYALHTHQAANLLDGQIRAKVHSDVMQATVQKYRDEANLASAMLKRMEQGHTGLQEVATAAKPPFQGK
jgi:hypothetical protein